MSFYLTTKLSLLKYVTLKTMPNFHLILILMASYCCYPTEIWVKTENILQFLMVIDE